MTEFNEECDPEPVDTNFGPVHPTIEPFVQNCQELAWVFGGFSEPAIMYLVA